MKVKSKTDTTTGANEKVKLIDGFGFNGSYNYLADSFKLSPIYFYLRSTLFKQINISASTTLNPYQHDSLGININKYAWEGKWFQSRANYWWKYCHIHFLQKQTQGSKESGGG